MVPPRLSAAAAARSAYCGALVAKDPRPPAAAVGSEALALVALGSATAKLKTVEKSTASAEAPTC